MRAMASPIRCCILKEKCFTFFFPDGFQIVSCAHTCFNQASCILSLLLQVCFAENFHLTAIR